MCRSIEEMLNEESERKSREIARRMIADNGLPLKKIAEYSGLTVEEVSKLASEIGGKQ